MDDRNFDKRIVHRNIEKGIITEKEHKKYISGLHNLEEECDVIDILPPGQKAPPEEEETEEEGETGDVAPEDQDQGELNNERK